MGDAPESTELNTLKLPPHAASRAAIIALLATTAPARTQKLFTLTRLPVMHSSIEKLSIVGALLAFMRDRKKWWLAPILIILMLLGLLGTFI